MVRVEGMVIPLPLRSETTHTKTMLLDLSILISNKTLQDVSYILILMYLDISWCDVTRVRPKGLEQPTLAIVV